jgi:hypothetical protein
MLYANACHPEAKPKDLLLLNERRSLVAALLRITQKEIL